MPGVSGGKALVRNDMQKTVMCLRLQGRDCNGWLKFAGCLHGTGVLPELCRRTADVPLLPGGTACSTTSLRFLTERGADKKLQIVSYVNRIVIFSPHLVCVLQISPRYLGRRGYQ